MAQRAQRLHHVNINTPLVAETTAFFSEIVGLTVGNRPTRDIPGAWLCDEAGAPVIHVMHWPERLRGRADSGSIDHIAFICTDFEGCRANLETRGIAFESHEMPERGVRIIFLKDPNGVQVELNFPA